MKRSCPNCATPSHCHPKIVRKGFYWRKSDGQRIERYHCKVCSKSFSTATTHPCFGQNKRHKNEILRKLLCSGISKRRVAKVLNINRITVVRKLLFLSQQAELEIESSNIQAKKCEVIEFDDMETFEHTKCKPLSISLAVESGSRRILGFEVSQMPAKGHLAKLAVKKYGLRVDRRRAGRLALFRRLKAMTVDEVLIKSDQNPHYPCDIKRIFPHARHETFKGQRGSIVGQGELKKIRFDPLFSLNHTCAMFRANVNRLFRRTWCTTKRPDRLVAHLNLYVQFHNQNLN